MSLSALSVQNVLNQYHRALKARSGGHNEKEAAEVDRVSISEEGRRQARLERIGDQAVRAYRGRAIEESQSRE